VIRCAVTIQLDYLHTIHFLGVLSKSHFKVSGVVHTLTRESDLGYDVAL